MEEKKKTMHEIVADFTTTQICIGGNTFFKGYFTVAVMNYGKEKITALLYASAPILEMLRLLHGAYFDEKMYDKAGDAVRKIYISLSQKEPFCYLFSEEETELLIAPNDPKGRSCRTFAARSHRLEREKAVDHPALAMYRTRLNTINKHLQRGKIDPEFAEIAKGIAEEFKTKACSSVRYYNEHYASDISQAGIYGAAEKKLGRPPIRKEG